MLLGPPLPAVARIPERRGAKLRAIVQQTPGSGKRRDDDSAGISGIDGDAGLGIVKLVRIFQIGIRVADDNVAQENPGKRRIPVQLRVVRLQAGCSLRLCSELHSSGQEETQCPCNEESSGWQCTKEFHRREVYSEVERRARYFYLCMECLTIHLQRNRHRPLDRSPAAIR